MPPSSSSADRRNDEPKYRGVRKRKWGKWVSEIRLPNSRQRIWLGSYDSPEKAARAFDAALFCLRGNTANFNFPHQPPNIPGGTDLHPSQIQAVAATFANSYSDSPPAPASHLTNSYSMEMEEDSSIIDTHYTNTNTHPHHDDHNHIIHDVNNNNINNGVQDFGIFPGFDDYFMPMHPPLTVNVDYQGEEVFDDSQDPSSFLWNF